MGDSGKAVKPMNQEVKLELDDDFKKALTKGDTTAEVNEPTKYILMENAFVESVNDDRVKHFTYYQDRDEVIQVDDILNHARLIPIVFKSKHDDVNKRIKKTAELFNNNVHDHADGMMSLKGFTSKLFAMMLRQDTNPMPTDKEIKKMFGGR